MRGLIQMFELHLPWIPAISRMLLTASYHGRTAVLAAYGSANILIKTSIATRAERGIAPNIFEVAIFTRFQQRSSIPHSAPEFENKLHVQPDERSQNIGVSRNSIHGYYNDVALRSPVSQKRDLPPPQPASRARLMKRPFNLQTGVGVVFFFICCHLAMRYMAEGCIHIRQASILLLEIYITLKHNNTVADSGLLGNIFESR